jgi:3-deoxy-manno-octulosonate cytidylyltransferase (CMP-KDO synthetase)
VVNIQGDEPLVSPRAIDQLAKAMIANPGLQMATLATAFKDRQELASPNTAKIAVDGEGYALYFSRSVIPCRRESARFDLCDYRKHIGMYAYRTDFIKQFASWAPGRLEGIEQLEQLRALEHGVRIKVVDTRHYSPSVDTPRDLRRVARLLK